MCIQSWKINELNACWRKASWKYTIQMISGMLPWKGNDCLLIKTFIVIFWTLDAPRFRSNKTSWLGNPVLRLFQLLYPMLVARGPLTGVPWQGLKERYILPLKDTQARVRDQNRWEPSVLGVGSEPYAQLFPFSYFYMIGLHWPALLFKAYKHKTNQVFNLSGTDPHYV